MTKIQNFKIDIHEKFQRKERIKIQEEKDYYNSFHFMQNVNAQEWRIHGIKYKYPQEEILCNHSNNVFKEFAIAWERSWNKAEQEMARYKTRHAA